MTTLSHDPGEGAPSVPELTAAIARGDEAAFTLFHRMYWKRIFAYLMVVAKGDETVAADLTQVTMVRAARHLRAMESEGALWAWLSRVARNAWIDTCRSRGRRPSLVSWNENEVLLEAGADMEAPLVNALEEALGCLEANERLLIEKTYFEGHRQAELASELGLSLKAVESRLTRLRAKLRQQIIHFLRDEEAHEEA